jgi:outer membrane lipoprotein-sorting protein
LNSRLNALVAIPAVALFLLGCVGPQSVLAQPENVAAVEPAAEPSALTVAGLLDHMEVVRKTVQTFQADVVKTSVIELLEETERFEGTLKFKAPRLLRLELKNAANEQETIFIVGPEYGWIYRVYKKQAERALLSEGTSEAEKGNPLEYGLTKDMHGLEQGYDLALLPEEEVGGRRAVPLELTPEGGTTYTSGKIIFWIDLDNWLPIQVREYKSNNEIVETHTFSNIELNKRVSDSNFEFKPPRDVDVILHDVLQ